MKNKNITLYVLASEDYGKNYYIKKRIVEISNTDIIKKYKGNIKITLVDSWQNDHNGDFEDENIYGFETYELAKNGHIKIIQDKILDYKQLIKRIKDMKEPINEKET